MKKRMFGEIKTNYYTHTNIQLVVKLVIQKRLIEHLLHLHQMKKLT